MPKVSHVKAKRTSDGRFVSKAEADRLLALEPTNDENAPPNANNSAHLPLVVMTDPRSEVPRRQRTGMNEREMRKYRSIELALEGERARTALLVERIAEQRLEIAALQPVAEARRSKALLASMDLCKKRSTEIQMVKDALRKAKDMNVRARAKAAADATQIAQRMLVRIRARKARRVSIKQTIKKSIPPGDDDSRARYDFVRNHAMKLQGFLSGLFADGCAGESAVKVISYFLQHNRELCVDLANELGIPSAVEAEVVEWLQKHWGPEDGAAMKHNTGMTWRGYKAYSMQTFRKWSPHQLKWVQIEMPYGGRPPQPPRAWRVQKLEKHMCAAYGLQQSADGLTAWCNMIKMLQTRLEAVPEDQLPAGQDVLQVWFGADAFRCYAANSVKMVMCAIKTMVERRALDGNKRLEGWVTNSHQNHIRAAIYEGGDSYAEFCLKGSVVQEQLRQLTSKGLHVKGRTYQVSLGLFGDMAFLDSVLGGSGCQSNHPCMLCNVHKDHIMMSTEAFKRLGIPQPQTKTRHLRCQLSHSLGVEYGLPEPYECPGCGMHIQEHGQGQPRTKKELDEYREKHWGQQWNRPPLTQVDVPNIVACSMHGKHNLLAQTWFATVTQHLYDTKVVEKVNAVVCDEWKMKRHKHKAQTTKKPTTKDTPHFNGPEGDKVIKHRATVLDIVLPANSGKAVVRDARIQADRLWQLQDSLFETWSRESPATQQGRDALAREAEKAAIAYVKQFVSCCSSSDGTLTMHYAMHHWPQHIRDHGSMSLINAQGLEACNQYSKRDSTQHCNRQPARVLKDGSMSVCRTAQLLARAMMSTIFQAKRLKERVLKRHVKKSE